MPINWTPKKKFKPSGLSVSGEVYSEGSTRDRFEQPDKDKIAKTDSLIDLEAKTLADKQAARNDFRPLPINQTADFGTQATLLNNPNANSIAMNTDPAQKNFMIDKAIEPEVNALTKAGLKPDVAKQNALRRLQGNIPNVPDYQQNPTIQSGEEIDRSFLANLPGNAANFGKNIGKSFLETAAGVPQAVGIFTSNLRSGIAPSYAMGIEAPRIATPEEIEANPIYQAGKKISDVAQSIKTNAYKDKDFITGTLPQAIGSQLGFYLTGGLSSKLGMGAATGAALTGALSQGASGYQEALQYTNDPTKLYGAFLINAGIGTSEALPIADMFTELDKYSAGAVQKGIKKLISSLALGAKEGTEEFVQEFGQQVASDLTAKAIYDQSRDLYKTIGNAYEGGAAGFVTGFLATIIGTKFRNKNLSKTDKQYLKDAQENLLEAVKPVQKEEAPQPKFQDRFKLSKEQLSQGLAQQAEPTDFNVKDLSSRIIPNAEQQTADLPSLEESKVIPVKQQQEIKAISLTPAQRFLVERKVKELGNTEAVNQYDFKNETLNNYAKQLVAVKQFGASKPETNLQKEPEVQAPEEVLGTKYQQVVDVLTKDPNFDLQAITTGLGKRFHKPTEKAVEQLRTNIAQQLGMNETNAQKNENIVQDQSQIKNTFATNEQPQPIEPQQVKPQETAKVSPLTLNDQFTDTGKKVDQIGEADKKVENTTKPISAVRLNNGEIVSDETAKVHADLVTNGKVKAENIADTGFIINGEYKSLNREVLPDFVRQAQAKKQLEGKKPKPQPESNVSNEQKSALNAKPEQKPLSEAQAPVLSSGDANNKVQQSLNKINAFNTEDFNKNYDFTNKTRYDYIKDRLLANYGEGLKDAKGKLIKDYSTKEIENAYRDYYLEDYSKYAPQQKAIIDIGADSKPTINVKNQFVDTNEMIKQPKSKGLQNKPAQVKITPDKANNSTNVTIEQDGKVTHSWHATTPKGLENRVKLANEIADGINAPTGTKPAQTEQTIPDKVEKQPYEMTREEYAKSEQDQVTTEEQKFYVGNAARGTHKVKIEKALKNNKTVPENVLADYPNLKEKYLAASKDRIVEPTEEPKGSSVSKEPTIKKMLAKRKEVATKPTNSEIANMKPEKGQGEPSKEQIPQTPEGKTILYHGSDKLDFQLKDNVHLGTKEQANMRNNKNVTAYITDLKPSDFSRSKDTGGDWDVKIKTAKKSGKKGIVYLNRYEGMTTGKIQDLDKRGLLDKLDSMSDTEFKKYVPEAKDSYIIFDKNDIKPYQESSEQSRVPKEGTQAVASKVVKETPATLTKPKPKTSQAKDWQHAVIEFVQSNGKFKPSSISRAEGAGYGLNRTQYSEENGMTLDIMLDELGFPQESDFGQEQAVRDLLLEYNSPEKRKAFLAQMEGEDQEFAIPEEAKQELTVDNNALEQIEFPEYFDELQNDLDFIFSTTDELTSKGVINETEFEREIDNATRAQESNRDIQDAERETSGKPSEESRTTEPKQQKLKQDLDRKTLQNRKRHLELIVENDKSTPQARTEAKRELIDISKKLGRLSDTENQFDMFGDAQDQISLFRKEQEKSRNVFNKMSKTGQDKALRIAANAFLDENPDISFTNLSKDRAAAVTYIMNSMANAMRFDPRTADILTFIHEANHAALVNLTPSIQAIKILKENGWDGQGNYKEPNSNPSLEAAYEKLAEANEKWYSETKDGKGKPFTKQFIAKLKDLWNKIASYLYRNGLYTQAGYFESLYNGKLREMAIEDLGREIEKANVAGQLAQKDDKLKQQLADEVPQAQQLFQKLPQDEISGIIPIGNYELESLRKQNVPEPQMFDKWKAKMLEGAEDLIDSEDMDKLWTAMGNELPPTTVTKATEPDQPEMKTRGVAKSIEAKAIREEVVERIDNLPQYEVEAQTPYNKQAEKMVSENPAQVKKMIDGEIPVEHRLLPSLLTAYKNYALREGKIDEVIKLAQKDNYTMQEATKAGQFSSAFQDRDPLSPFKAIGEVITAREEARKNKGYDKELNDLQTKIKTLEDEIVKRDEKYRELEAQKKLDKIKSEEDFKQRRTKRTQTKEALKQEWNSYVNILYRELGQLNMAVPLNANLAKAIHGLARNLVQRGVLTASGVADAIHEVAVQRYKGITKRDILEVIASYGKEPATVEELQKQINDLKKQAGTILKIEDIEQGKTPFKRTVEQIKPSEELAKLQDELKALEKQKEEVNNKALIQRKINSLNRQIEIVQKKLSGQYTAPEKAMFEFTDEIKAKQDELAKLREELKQQMEASGVTAQVTLERTKKMIETKTADLQGKIDRGEYSQKENVPNVDAAKVKLQEKLTELRNRYNTIQKIGTAITQEEAKKIAELSKRASDLEKSNDVNAYDKARMEFFNYVDELVQEASPFTPEIKKILFSDKDYVHDLRRGEVHDLSTLAPIRAAENMDKKRFGWIKQNILFPIQDADKSFQKEIKNRLAEKKAMLKGLNHQQKKEVFEVANNKQTTTDAKVKEAADKLRKQYSDLLDELNGVRFNNDQEPIAKRKDIITHYQELAALEEILSFTGQTISKVPVKLTTLKNFMGNNPMDTQDAKKRIEEMAKEKPEESYTAFLEPTLRTIHFDSAIRNANKILDYKTTLRSPDRSADDLSVKPFQIKYPNAYKYWKDYIGRLQGKRNFIDAKAPTLAEVLGTTNRIFASGSIGGNISTVLTQPSSIVNTVSETGFYAIPGQLAINVPKWYRFFRDNSRVGMGRQYEPYHQAPKMLGSKILGKVHNKVSNIISIPVGVVDREMVGGAFLSGYFKARALGISEEEAIRYGDDVAERTQASANIADRPPVNYGKIKTAFGQFQTFSYNNYSQIKNDIVMKAINNKKTAQGVDEDGLGSIDEGRGKATTRFVGYAIASVVMGLLYAAAGIRDPNREEDAKFPLIDNEYADLILGVIISKIPGISSIRFGGTPITQLGYNVVVYLQGSEREKAVALGKLKNIGARMIPGGGQIKKTAGMANAMSNNGQVKSASGKRVNFTISNNDFWNLAKGYMYGVYTTEEGRAYLDKLNGKADTTLQIMLNKRAPKNKKP